VPFEKEFEVKWADCDPNGHARHSVYSDYCTHVRFSFLAQSGFPPPKFVELRFGPVILTETVEFLRELALGERIRVDAKGAGASEDGRIFRIKHQIFRQSGELAARIVTQGGWMNLDKRKLMPPPPELASALAQMERSPEFEVITPQRPSTTPDR
jgi:acyl-CoA thioester hydrolase